MTTEHTTGVHKSGLKEPNLLIAVQDQSYRDGCPEDSLYISRKESIRNVTIRRQIGLEEPIIKEIEQNRLTWYGHVQRMAEGRLPKTALKWIPKQKRARGRPKKNWM